MSRLLLHRLPSTIAVFGLLVGGLISCSQHSSKPLSKGYHNLNAHFNAYVIAREQIDGAEQILFKSRQENYNQLLPVLLPVDSILAQPVKPQLDDAIKKASLIPERHQNSKWLDNAYILIGRARLLKQDLPNAIEVFKYVNTKGTSEEDKHTALVYLMRAYTEAGDYTNAQNVGEFLRTQPLNKINTRDFYLTKAYMHERQGEYLIAVGVLEATFPVLKKGESTARLHLIAGQLYDLLGQPGKALEQYAKVNKSGPNYDQSFYANLYSIQSNGLLGDAKRTSESAALFNQMLNDRKNVDLKDKIYYTMGLLEARSGRIDQAISFYKLSIQAAAGNTTQIPQTYAEIGRLYFEKKSDYVRAKAYYDSAMALLPQQSPNYTALANRKKVLDEFVLYSTTIRSDDSLISLAGMKSSELNRMLDNVLDKQEKEEKAQQAIAQQLADQAASGTVSNVPGATNSNLPPAERWVLYNPIAMSQGRQEFSVRWGNRPLEDDWRRSNKDASASVPGANSPLNTNPAANAINPNTPLQQPDAPNAVANVDNSSAARQAKKKEMMARIPFSPAAQIQARQRIENALYQLGKLYKFELDKPAEAVATFEQLLNRYPNTLQKPEIYYLLHLSNEQLAKTSDWKEKLLIEFPNTSYARLVGRSASQTSGSETQAVAAYTQIYDLYKGNNPTEALARAANALNTFAGTQLEDKLALLRVILIGKVQGADPYRQALNEFVRDYPGSELLPHAKEMQAVANQSAQK
jgi:tetratricopeptide (TPR) repeat protein